MKKLLTTLTAVAGGALAAIALPSAAAERPSVVPFVDTSTLVRDMVKQQVTIGGQSLPKVVVPARYCAGLAPNGSKGVKLPEIRWGVRATAPEVATRGLKATLAWPGQRKKDEVLPDGMTGSVERVFTFPRPGPRSILVTLLPVGGGRTVCVSDSFVADPPVEVLVNVAGAPGQRPIDRRSTF